MAADLYPFSSSLKPCEPVDSFDTRYLNQSYSPILNPLSKPLNIELYNKTWFDKPLRITKNNFGYGPFPPLSDLHVKTRTSYAPPLIEQSDTYILTSLSPLVLFKSLSTIVD